MVKSVPDLVDRPRERAGSAHLDEPERGAGRPDAVADVLAALPDGWDVREDVRRRGSRFAGIDHVVIGPSGIFVIAVRDWSGSVTVVDNVVRHDREAREDDTERCADAALAVAEVVEAVDGYGDWLLPVLCVARDEPLLDWAVDVRVCSTATLTEALTSLPPVLSPQLVAEALTALDSDAVDEGTASSADEPTVPDVPVLATVPAPPVESQPDRAEINARLTAADAAPDTEQPHQRSPRRGARAALRVAGRAAAAVSAAIPAKDAEPEGTPASSELAPPERPKAAPKAPRRLLRRGLTGIVGIAVAALLVANGPQLFTSLRSTITNELDGTSGTCLPSDPTPAAGKPASGAKVGGTTGGGTSKTRPGSKSASAQSKPGAQPSTKPSTKAGKARAARLAAAKQRRADQHTQALEGLPAC